jgi:cytochrome c2
MYRRFVPAFKVLSHTDRPQLPDNLVRIDFSTQAATFAPLEPHGNFAPGSPEQIGFVIAKQNCLRCHFLGTSGGTKSGRSWRVLSQYAREEPKYFQAYVHNPKSIDPHANMEPQSDYDPPTLAALSAYFSTFSEEKPK